MKKAMAPIIAELLIILFAFFIVVVINSPLKYTIFPILRRIEGDYNYVETMSFSAMDVSYEGQNIKIENVGYRNLTNITIFLDYTELGVIPGPLPPGNFTYFYVGNLSINGSRFIILSVQGAKAQLPYNKTALG